MMTDALKAHEAARERLLAQIVTALAADERFVAAWLTGSLGRNEPDAFSDLDLTVVVADAHSQTLCARPWQASAKTTDERLALISRFGQPAIIHENNNNAPPGGTFTCSIYNNALVVDWALIPQAQAQRPSPSKLLFDKAGVSSSPPAAPESVAERQDRASEQVAFFWMMAAVTIKYILRQDTVRVLGFLDMLLHVIREVERLIAGEAQRHQRGSPTTLESTSERQIKAVRQLCEKMLLLMPEVVRLGGHVPSSPMSAIERLLDLA